MLSPMADQLKFYTDNHIAKAVAVQLRKRGIDAIRCEEVNMANASDLAHLEYAAKEKRILITNDDDFLKLDQNWRIEGKNHAGIMFCLSHIQGKNMVGRIIQECLELHELIAGGAGTIEEDIENQIIYIS
jgi:predicted nuclease of predicted toxin-antitoxin system